MEISLLNLGEQCWLSKRDLKEHTGDPDTGGLVHWYVSVCTVFGSKRAIAIMRLRNSGGISLMCVTNLAYILLTCWMRSFDSTICVWRILWQFQSDFQRDWGLSLLCENNVIPNGGHTLEDVLIIADSS